MEENNKLGNNTSGSEYSSSLYGTDPQPQEEVSENSSVYGQQETLPAGNTAVQEQDSLQQTEVTQASDNETQGQPQKTAAVSLEKTVQTQGQPVQSYQPAGTNQQGFYGQPVNANQMNGNQPNYGGQPYQQGFYGQPVNQAMQYAAPKRSRTGLIIGITAAAAVVIIAAVCFLFSRSLLASPQKQLAGGLMNMTKEMEAYSSSISEDIGFDELGILRSEQPMHTNIDLSFTDPAPSASIDNFSIEIDAVSDNRNKQGKYDLNLGTYGFDMEIGSIVADSNILYFSSPLVFKEDVYSLDLTNLGKDFNNSAWADLLDTTISEDSSYTLFGDEDDDTADDSVNALEFGKIVEKYTKGMEGSIEYASIKEKREFPYGGTLAAYGGVQVTFDKDAYNEAMENMKDDILSSDFYADYLDRYKTTYGSDFDEFKNEFDNVIEQLFGIRFEQDFVLNFYLDKKGRIINISTPQDIAVSSLYADIDSIAVDIDFGGSDRTLDSIEGGIYMQSGEEILYLGISRTANVTEDFYNEDLTISLQSDRDDEEIMFYYGNDWGYSDKSYDMTISIEAAGESISLTADGGFEDIVKGEGYDFRINNAALTVDGEEQLIMSGVISMEPADNDIKIEVPQNAIDVLKMSENDIMTALYKAVYSLQ